MINLKLIKSSPEGMYYVYKNVFMTWISLIFNIIAIFSIGYLIEKLYYRNIQKEDIIITIICITLSIVIRYFANIKGVEYSYYASDKVKTFLRQKIYRKILNLGTSYNSKVNTSQITQISGEGIEQIEVYFSLYLPQFIYSMLAPSTLFVILSFFSLKVSIILLICVPLIPLSIIAVNKIAKRLLARYWHIYTNLGDNFLDNLKGLTTLKIYQDDEYKNQEMNEDAEHFRKITMKVLTMQLNSVTLMDLIAFGGASLGIIFALLEFQAGTISLGQTIIFVLLSGEFFIPLRLLGSYFHIAMNGVMAASKIFTILELPDIPEKNSTCNIDTVNIELKNIDFSYGVRQILHDINMIIPNNSFISIVGESGSGKSTIADLLMGLQEYKKGSILVNNVELNTLNEQFWMKNCTIVKHNNYIFSGTIYDNLIMGNENATEEQLNNVLKKVDLYDFVYEQGGLEFALLEGGTNLSGGQVQRLALARTLLHDAKIYIFDEATSSIDVESEKIIFNTIRELRKIKTIVLISHRLANVVDSDKIYVLEDGKIVNSGVHNELLLQENLYKTLFTKQNELEQIFKTQGK